MSENMNDKVISLVSFLLTAVIVISRKKDQDRSVKTTSSIPVCMNSTCMHSDPFLSEMTEYTNKTNHKTDFSDMNQNNFNIEMGFEEVLSTRLSRIPKSVSLSYSNTTPLMIMRGEGSYLFDHTGKRYLDTRNNVCHVGHCHPRVIRAVMNQVKLLNTNTRYLHPTMCTLAEKLVSKMPPKSGLCKVFFVNSGSEANDLALRLAISKTQSKNMICVEGAYHGHTLSVLNVSPYKFRAGKKPLGQSNQVRTVPVPDLYRSKFKGNNDAVSNMMYAKTVNDAIIEFSNDGIAAFIIEGGMSVAGVVLPSYSYLKEAIGYVRKAGGLYIADEVQTGFGRFGLTYWGFELNNPDIYPDIVTVGKPFGNGMPLAAVITTEDIASNFDMNGVEYFNTFGGNPVCAAAGLAVMCTIDDDQLQDNALIVGKFLVQRLKELQLMENIIGDVRGCGLFIGVELVRDHETHEPASLETSFICSVLKNEFNILTSIDGPYDNVLVIKPPLVFSLDDANYFISSFMHACRKLKGSNVQAMTKTPT